MSSSAAIGRLAPGKDLYEVLKVPRTATDDEIKQSYRRLALAIHPDKNPDDPDAAEKFRMLNQAYVILNDPKKRKIYDKVGLYGLRAAEQFQGNADWDELTTCQKVVAVSCGVFCGIVTGFYCGCCCCCCCCCCCVCGYCVPEFVDEDLEAACATDVNAIEMGDTEHNNQSDMITPMTKKLVTQ